MYAINFRAEKFDCMVEMSKKYGMEMEEKGDVEHIEVMEKIQGNLMQYLKISKSLLFESGKTSALKIDMNKPSVDNLYNARQTKTLQITMGAAR